MQIGTLGTGIGDGTGILGLIMDTATDLGGGVLAIIGIVLGIAVAYFLFRFGWRKLKGSVR